ncbi:C-terminal processing periplasmic-protease-3 [Leptospira ryugenii]|uniref:C-terminal processing periplasmic-protease-3 n=1 Tax=Leptospira ryugenii TaxID=1917863 RepID=A0A2P2DY92_9LEPT|nr:S41 family peptidase [Leptospira ryugenii]GBF49599.1 C-terminal processing periplasmic-protease-3 [Leptospira ryugenii]
MKNKERLLWLSLVFILISFIFFGSLPRVKAISTTGEAYLQVFHEVLGFVESDFVEPADEKKLYVGAIQGALQSLGDPHTRFLDSDEFLELQNETKGSFGGIGVEVSFQDGAFIIVAPLEGTPAWKAGLLPQDRIIEINGKSTKNVSMADSINMMRGEVGSSLSMKIERKGVKDPFTVSMIRELIKIQYIRSSYLPQTKTGYIKLAQFMGRENTAKQFEDSIKKLIESGAKNLVIDLRMNPGGLVDLSVELADLFLPANQEILSVRGRGGVLVKTFRSDKQGAKFLDIPLAILLNGGSASASEILAGALQDHKRAKVVGTQSFGKGSVQSIFPLSHKTGVAITIQKYFTPSGKSIHGKGITPDVLVNPISANDDEKFAFEKLQKRGKLRTFFNAHSDYNDETVLEFQNLLKEEKLTISDSVIRLFLFNELRSTQSTQAPNTELDLQLKEAIRILNL